MEAVPQLATNVYIEAFGDRAVLLLPAGSALPAVRSHLFSTAQDGQSAIDIHLLYGTSAAASGNTSIGRWRISEISPASRGQPDVRVGIRVDAAGLVDVTATLDNRLLPVSLLSEDLASVPVGAGDTSVDTLGSIRQHVDAGDREGARHELVDLLHADPRNVAAWLLLATLLKDPSKQADCYRQILRIDPGNPHATARLKALTSLLPEPSPQGESTVGESATLQCDQCGGVAEVRFVGELRDKRAICPYCGSEVDLPDTFRRVQRRRDHEQHRWGSRTVESVVIETRSDHLPGGQPDQHVADVEAIHELLRELGPRDLDAEILEELRDRGLVVMPDKKVVVSSLVLSKKEQSLLSRALSRFGLDVFDGTIEVLQDQMATDQVGIPLRRGQLTPDEIIDMAGGALPPEERRRCPECDAVVSRSAVKCSWCSAPLTASEEE